MPKHGEERGWRIEPGSMGGPGLHSEAERWCAHCEHWCPIVGTAGALYFRMMHESKECIAPVSADVFPAWLERARKRNHFGN